MNSQIRLCIEFLLNTSDVAESLGVSYWTVRKLILNNQIKATKINGRWKIPASSVESYMTCSESVIYPFKSENPQSVIEYSQKIEREIMGGKDE